MIRVNNGVVRYGIIILILMVVLSAGCIKSAQKVLGRESNAGTSVEDSSLNADPSAMNPPADSSTPVHPPSTPVPAVSPAVDEVSPYPYITPDPYRLPYRDHGNWSTAEPVRTKKYPQFTKSYILRSNSTAVRVNVTQAPLIIDLTYSPQWSNPDHTGIGRGTNEDGSVNAGTSINSFVYSTAVVTIYNEGSRSVVEQDGYGQGFSMDLEKKITIYREGTYVITLEGNFIDVKMAVTTGTGADKPAGSPAGSGAAPPDEEGEWG